MEYIVLVISPRQANLFCRAVSSEQFDGTKGNGIARSGAVRGEAVALYRHIKIPREITYFV